MQHNSLAATPPGSPAPAATEIPPRHRPLTLVAVVGGKPQAHERFGGGAGAAVLFALLAHIAAGFRVAAEEHPGAAGGVVGQMVEGYAPEKVILYSCGEAFGHGSLARGDARWDSDADILVVMPFEGRHLAKIREMLRLCPVRFLLDFLVQRPEEIGIRHRGGDPVVREALDHGEVLHG